MQYRKQAFGQHHAHHFPQHVGGLNPHDIEQMGDFSCNGTFAGADGAAN